jgi:hypothetical protein
LLAAFRSYGIEPTSKGRAGRTPGSWDAPPSKSKFKYDRTHFESMKSDPDELFRFLWENQKLFKLHGDAHTRVLSVRPCIRVGRDGFMLRETVAEYHQQLKLYAGELSRLHIVKPPDMPAETEVTLFGGNAVIFDEYGHVKYNIGKSIMDTDRQSRRLAYLWNHGGIAAGASKDRALSRLHMRRSTNWYRSVETHEGEDE